MIVNLCYCICREVDVLIFTAVRNNYMKKIGFVEERWLFMFY